jgi:hypothetical protein
MKKRKEKKNSKPKYPKSRAKNRAKTESYMPICLSAKLVSPLAFSSFVLEREWEAKKRSR